MEWIDVNERLPAHSNSVLGCCPTSFNTIILEVYFLPSRGWFRCEEVFEKKPIHVLFWEELPQLPKGIQRAI